MPVSSRDLIFKYKMNLPPGRVPHVRPSVRGPKMFCSTAFTRHTAELFEMNDLFADIARQWRGFAPSSSAHVRWGDRISCYAAPDTAACAAFIKESRIECNNATNFNRKSGERGAPVHYKNISCQDRVTRLRKKVAAPSAQLRQHPRGLFRALPVARQSCRRLSFPLHRILLRGWLRWP